jgi:pimeloyl-ACP methyl ester carboxylesterase
MGGASVGQGDFEKTTLAEGLKKVGRSVRSVLVNNAGHYPAEQVPAAFNTALIRFLDDAKLSNNVRTS